MRIKKKNAGKKKIQGQKCASTQKKILTHGDNSKGAYTVISLPLCANTPPVTGFITKNMAYLEHSIKSNEISLSSESK